MQDISALIGMLGMLEGEMRVRDHPALVDEVPDWMLRLPERLTRVGLLSLEPSPEDVRTAVGNLNQRLRYVLGEYDNEDEGQTL